MAQTFFITLKILCNQKTVKSWKLEILTYTNKKAFMAVKKKNLYHTCANYRSLKNVNCCTVLARMLNWQANKQTTEYSNILYFRNRAKYLYTQPSYQTHFWALPFKRIKLSKFPLKVYMCVCVCAYYIYIYTHTHTLTYPPTRTERASSHVILKTQYIH